jgi:NMD protein affecting ribosome stability and mRNA decay
MMPHNECPFCDSCNVQDESGRKRCLDCLAEYEIDERSECIFANTDSLSLPLKVKGTVCSHCGLLQDVDTAKCRLCGTPIKCDQ